MKHEGHMRQYGKKWDKYEDGEMWAILAVIITIN